MSATDESPLLLALLIYLGLREETTGEVGEWLVLVLVATTTATMFAVPTRSLDGAAGNGDNYSTHFGPLMK
jgi:hypothetical protein